MKGKRKESTRLPRISSKNNILKMTRKEINSQNKSNTLSADAVFQEVVRNLIEENRRKNSEKIKIRRVQIDPNQEMIGKSLWVNLRRKFSEIQKNQKG